MTEFNNINDYYKSVFDRMGLVWESGDVEDDGYSFEERE